MDECKDKEPTKRILDAAASLFAQKGFAAVGVREIAKHANVNIAMISYYYNGKIGILKSIIEEYFRELQIIIKEVNCKQLSASDGLREMVSSMVALMQRETDLCKVAILELPFNIPEIEDFKIKMLIQHNRIVKDSFHSKKPVCEEPTQNVIIGPALTGLIFSNFIFGNLLTKAYNIKLDDQFYKTYSDTISTLFLRGIKGVVENAKEFQNIKKND